MKKLTYLVLIIMIISLLTACNRPNNDLGKTPEENLEKRRDSVGTIGNA